MSWSATDRLTRAPRSRRDMTDLLRAHPQRWWHLTMPGAVVGKPLRTSATTAEAAILACRQAFDEARRLHAGHLDDAEAMEQSALWVGDGGSRTVYRLGEWHVLKIGYQPDDMDDEVIRWSHATPEARSWLCPVVEGDEYWSIMPLLDDVTDQWTYRDQGRRVMRTDLVRSAPKVLCHLNDLYRPGNWGMYMNVPVVLDYNDYDYGRRFDPDDPDCQ
jgi:hypothetical protein